MVLDWPHRNGSKPVTTALNHAILKAAAAVLSREHPHDAQSFAHALDRCGSRSGKWRHEYVSLMEQFVRLQVQASPLLIEESCRAALDFAAQSFVIRTGVGDNGTDTTEPTTSVYEAFAAPPPSLVLPTETLIGTVSLSTTEGSSKHHTSSSSAAAAAQFQLASPHGSDSEPIWISGDAAIAQVKAWCDYGCMEPSAALHASAVCASTNVSEYVTGKTFCLLGITSEMGPTLHLLKLPKAHVMGVARAGPKLDSLKKWFQSNAPDGTTLQLTAADLLNDTVAIAQWIVATAPPHQPLVLMPLAYMDGEANVRVTVAMDAIVTHVIQHYRGTTTTQPQQQPRVSLVYLTSPTTIYTIPKEAALDAKQRYHRQGSSFTNQMISLASFGNWLRPSDTWKQLDNDDDDDNENDDDNAVIVYNGTYHLQGPNYCLAKLMQQWRCIVANAAEDTQVWSVHAPHAPGTRTRSVQHNAQAAVALEGIPYFPPMVTFDVLPCSSLLTAIVLHQLQQQQQQRRQQDQKQPRKRQPQQHPMELFWDGAVHGGGWRCPYSSESMLALTFCLGKAWAQPGWCRLGALAPKPNDHADQKTSDDEQK